MWKLCLKIKTNKKILKNLKHQHLLSNVIEVKTVDSIKLKIDIPKKFKIYLIWYGLLIVGKCTVKLVDRLSTDVRIKTSYKNYFFK